jgi:hypothetical protein
MSAHVVAEATLIVGEPMVLHGPSPTASFQVVFEDDGQTAYFYGLDPTREDNPILDGLHIYNVTNVGDADRPSNVEIAWSDDGLKAILLINRHPHAIFDFQSSRAYCRTGLPVPSQGFTSSHDWDERAIELFQ